MHRQVIIIGAGPAGIATAIQLKRYGIEPLIIEKNKIGGLLNEANLVENYLGFPKGIKGKELVNIFKKQLKNSEIEIIFEEVLNISYTEQEFLIKTNKASFSCKRLVIASGTQANELPYKNLHYSIEPLLKYKNKKIAIIGAGDAAFDYAINLSKANDIDILNRGEHCKCLPVLFKRVEKIKRIRYLVNINIEKHINSNKYDYILAASGRKPALYFLKESISSDKLFYVGDVKNENYRQCSISIGNGIEIAMLIYKLR